MKMDSNDIKLRELQNQLAKMTDTVVRLAGEKEVPTFGDYARSFLERKMANPAIRDSTKANSRIQIVNHLIPAFGHLPIEEINETIFLRWVNEAKERGELTRFFNARKSMLEILNAARDERIIERTPKIDNPDEQRSVGRVLAPREILSILRNCRDRLFRFFFFVLWKMGCRPREILRWEWDMIKWGEPGKTWINIPARISKTGRTRSIPINPNVSRRLAGQWARRPSSRFIFPSPRDQSKPQLSYNGAWKTACKHAGVDAVPYDLRRTFITRCAAEGKPLIYIARALDTSIYMLDEFYVKSQADVMENIVR